MPIVPKTSQGPVIYPEEIEHLFDIPHLRILRAPMTDPLFRKVERCRHEDSLTKADLIVKLLRDYVASR